MKNIYLKIVSLLIVFASVGFYSCSDGEDYLKYTEGGEISYTGKIDSLKIYPGRNRVKVEGLIISDPKVTEVRIYWNVKNDSIVVPVNRTAGVDTISVEIDNLPENVYNFEIRTFDKNNNKSIGVFESAEVYGDRYQNSLFNRPVLSNDLIKAKDSLSIKYASMDLTTGVIGTEIYYTSTDEKDKMIFVPIDNEYGVIEDYKYASTYKYRTVFLPEKTAIDTFYTDFVNFTPIAKPIIVNAAIPFKASSRSTRWGILADWITTNPIKVHNGYGGWDEWNGNIFNIESGWGAAAINNGKIYQTITDVQVATYILNVRIRDTNHKLSDAGGSYFVVAKGNSLPDVSDVTTSSNVLAFKRINSDLGTEYTYKLEFTIEGETTDITVGQITTQADGDPGRYCNVRSWDIVVK